MKRATTKKGSSRSFRHAFTTWLVQHLHALVFSAGQMVKNPVSSILTTAVIGVSLSLPAGFYLLLENAHRLTAGWAGAVQITLFLDMQADGKIASNLAQTLSKRDDVASVKIIDRDHALQEYMQNSGFGAALTDLDENPLPYVLLVQPAGSVLATSRTDALIDYLRSLKEVESAQFDRQWATRLLTFVEVFQRGAYILSCLLAFAVLLIVGNTIRLAIYNRRSEIEINKLFGATDAFIQRPFLYSGLIHGLGGAIMAWLILLGAAALLTPPVQHLANLYGSNFHVLGLGPRPTLGLIAAGGLLGLTGSWIAVHRHIRAIGLT
jgi:cell division transport system permease protein